MTREEYLANRRSGEEPTGFPGPTWEEHLSPDNVYTMHGDSRQYEPSVTVQDGQVELVLRHNGAFPETLTIRFEPDEARRICDDMNRALGTLEVPPEVTL
jgi:hypothetical protein